jgi:hypothetical protein
VGNLKKVAVILLALALIIAFPLPVYADDIINITVTDANNDGVNFGDVEPGYEVGDVAQDGTGAVTITIHADTNVDCNIQIRGSDNFTDGSGHTILLSNAKWDTDSGVDGATTMSANYTTISTSTAYIEKIIYVWHWLSVPSDQYASTYNTTFYYQAIAK